MLGPPSVCPHRHQLHHHHHPLAAACETGYPQAGSHLALALVSMIGMTAAIRHHNVTGDRLLIYINAQKTFGAEF